MLIKTVFSGFGGQGVIMMGYLLAIAGMYEEKNVTCLPSYGAEVRGGTANCTVVISTEEIASPVASEPEIRGNPNRHVGRLVFKPGAAVSGAHELTRMIP